MVVYSYTEAAMDCFDKKLQAEEVYDWDIDDYLEYHNPLGVSRQQNISIAQTIWPRIRAMPGI